MALRRSMYDDLMDAPIRQPVRPASAVALTCWCALVVFVWTGCADPSSVVGFEEYDSAARVRAIQQAGASKDRSAVPKLIARLESDDPAERLLAIRALERITGETHGFDHAGRTDERAAAVERWRSWHLSMHSQRTSGARDL